MWTQVPKSYKPEKPYIPPKQTKPVADHVTSYSDQEIFTRIGIPWMENKLVGVSRNNAAYQLGSFCHDYEMTLENACSLIYNELRLRSSDHEFTEEECIKTVKSAYKSRVSGLKRAAVERDLTRKDKPKKASHGNKHDKMPVEFECEDYDMGRILV